jgi:3-oxoadipate enol-lactonase
MASTEGMGSVGKEAARWMIGPRSFRRILPALGSIGPLQLFNPANAFVSQVQAILTTDDRSLNADLGNIECPTMVVVGNQDILTLNMPPPLIASCSSSSVARKRYLSRTDTQQP